MNTPTNFVASLKTNCSSESSSNNKGCSSNVAVQLLLRFSMPTGTITLQLMLVCVDEQSLFHHEAKSQYY
jgi:hypothetical protein